MGGVLFLPPQTHGCTIRVSLTHLIRVVWRRLMFWSNKSAGGSAFTIQVWGPSRSVRSDTVAVWAQGERLTGLCPVSAFSLHPRECVGCGVESGRGREAGPSWWVRCATWTQAPHHRLASQRCPLALPLPSSTPAHQSWHQLGNLHQDQKVSSIPARAESPWGTHTYPALQKALVPVSAMFNRKASPSG